MIYYNQCTQGNYRFRYSYGALTHRMSHFLGDTKYETNYGTNHMIGYRENIGGCFLNPGLCCDPRAGHCCFLARNLLKVPGIHNSAVTRYHG